MEEEAEELRRQRGEDTKQEIENKTVEDCSTSTTFDMFATDAELPPEVFSFFLIFSVMDALSKRFNRSFKI